MARSRPLSITGNWGMLGHSVEEILREQPSTHDFGYDNLNSLELLDNYDSLPIGDMKELGIFKTSLPKVGSRELNPFLES